MEHQDQWPVTGNSSLHPKPAGEDNPLKAPWIRCSHAGLEWQLRPRRISSGSIASNP